MEYSLQIERKKRIYSLIGLIILLIVFVIFCIFFLGIFGLVLLGVLLLFCLLSPPFMDKYKFFLFGWLFIIPCFDNIQPLLIGNTSVLTYALAGISVPVAIFLFYNKFFEFSIKIPHLKYLMLFWFYYVFKCL